MNPPSNRDQGLKTAWHLPRNIEHMDHRLEAAMRRLLRVFARIVGSVAGLLVGSVLLSWAAIAVVAWVVEVPEANLGFVYGSGVPGALVGATLRAAAGSSAASRVMRQTSSLPKALLGAVAGLVVGCISPLCVWCLHPDLPTRWWVVAIASASIPITAGAVIGSGWKAKPATEAQS